MNVKSLLVGVVVVAAGYAAVHAMKRPSAPAAPHTPTQAELETAQRALDKQLGDLKRKAESNAAAPFSEAFGDASRALAVQRLQDSSSDPAKQRLMAASNFWGFRYKQTVMVPEFCASLGIDLAPYVSAFERQNRDVARKADAIERTNPIDRAKLTPIVREKMRPIVEREFYDFAAAQGSTATGTCRMLREQAEGDNVDLALESLLPEVHAVLMASPN